jgi:hypothetical protein
MSHLNHLPSLSHLLNSAILLAILAQTVSLGDLILLPEQKKRLEQWCDGLTLKLDVINTAGFLRRWLRASRRAQMAEIFFGIVATIAVLSPAVVMGFWVYPSEGFLFAIGLAFLVIVLQGWAWSLAYKVFNGIGKQVIRELSLVDSIPGFLMLYLILAALGLLVIAGLGWLVLWSIPRLLGTIWFMVLKFSLNFYIGLIVTWIAIFLDGVITLTVAMLIWPFRLVIVIARAFMWRVSSYPKGPLAALILFVGAFLTVIRFSVKD